MSASAPARAGRGSATPDDGTRPLRIAAIGDIHHDGSTSGHIRDMFADVNQSADVLVVCGDLTSHGRASQMEKFVEELAGVDLPIVCVLGNHDYESDEQDECTRILCAAGVHVLDGTHIVLHGVGFAGTKGFAGGFGRGALGPFGEPLIKAFVDAALDEALKIEKAMRQLSTESTVVLLHYAPIIETVVGEPEFLYPFLGSSRLEQPLDTLGATVVFHGHAHHGSPEGRTPGGIPVYNVALPLLRALDVTFRIFTVPAPDRRHAPVATDVAAPGQP